jgi:hypothetical protein
MSFDPLSEQVLTAGVILTTVGFLLVFGASLFHFFRTGYISQKRVIISYDHKGNLIDPDDQDRVGDFFTTRNKFNNHLTQCYEQFDNLDLDDDVVSRAMNTGRVPQGLSNLRYFLADASLQFAILEAQASEANRDISGERKKLEACYAFVRDIHVDRLYLNEEAAAKELVYDVDFEIIDFGLRKPEVLAEYEVRNPARDYFAKDIASAEEL